MVDAALAELAPDEDVAALLAARERMLVVRSFSKAHAMAGLRAGYALANDADCSTRLSPAGGVSAPAQAAMLWAVRDGEAVVARRRAAAARERERLAAALRGSPFSFPAGHGHLVWLASTEEDGASIARRPRRAADLRDARRALGRRAARADRAARRRRHRPPGRRRCLS